MQNLLDKNLSRVRWRSISLPCFPNFINESEPITDIWQDDKNTRLLNSIYLVNATCIILHFKFGLPSNQFWLKTALLKVKQEPVDLLNLNESENMSRFCFNGESKSESNLALFTSLSWHCFLALYNRKMAYLDDFESYPPSSVSLFSPVWPFSAISHLGLQAERKNCLILLSIYFVPLAEVYLPIVEDLSQDRRSFCHAHSLVLEHRWTSYPNMRCCKMGKDSFLFSTLMARRSLSRPLSFQAKLSPAGRDLSGPREPSEEADLWVFLFRLLPSKAIGL